MLKRARCACIAVAFDFILPVCLSKRRSEAHKNVFFSGNKHICSCNILPCLFFLHFDGAKHPSFPDARTWPLLAAAQGSPHAPGSCHQARWAGCLPAALRGNPHSSFSPPTPHQQSHCTQKRRM